MNAPDRQDAPPLRIRRLALSVAIGAAILLAFGVFGRVEAWRAAEATRESAVDAAPHVHVATARREAGDVRVTLPAQTQAFDAASIYARATGYIAERRVDIGSRVHKGDLLLRIAAPDTDAQLAQAQATLGQLQAALVQAQANLKQAVANAHLAAVTKYRSTTLASEGWATRQNADNDTANANVQSANVTSAQAGIAVAEANLQAQRATVDRLATLAGYERVTAPFDGVITARRTDVGDLVQADQNGGTSLFDIVGDDVLRCSVYVPQSQALGIRDGIEATVTVPETPGVHFSGRIARNAAALDTASRSMLTEVDIPNADHRLRAGLFVDITFSVPRPHPVVVIPDAAIIFNGQGLMVATVEGGRAHFRPITIDHDLGTRAELRTGLEGGEQVITNPPADLVDGGKVLVPPAAVARDAGAPRNPPA